MSLKKLPTSTGSVSDSASAWFTAYQRIVNLNGTAIQLTDCAAIADPHQRRRYQAEVIVRALFESHVAAVLAPRAGFDVTATARELLRLIRADYGAADATDTWTLVGLMWRGHAPDSAAFVSPALDLPPLGGLPAEPAAGAEGGSDDLPF